VPAPEMSIITVTHNRRELLLRKYHSLKAQRLEPHRFEWIVCVNGSTDGTREMLARLEPSFHLKIISFEASHGVSEARNACSREAASEVLYLSDDDCLLEPDTLLHHLHFQQTTGGVAVGSLEFEDDERVRVWRPERAWYWNVNGANTSCPRDAFEAVGGFDDSLVGYGGEDLLLGYKLHQHGLPVHALPEARARHVGPDPMRARNVDKAKSAGRNAARIAAKYPELAFRLGVSAVSLLAKRTLLWPPLGPLWRIADPASYAYERAYLEGALQELWERNHA
jgi:GT2 family glycosyltransferase